MTGTSDFHATRKNTMLGVVWHAQLAWALTLRESESKVSLKPRITAGASIRSSHREEAGSESSTKSVEEASSLSQHAVEYTFHFRTEKDCIIHESFLTKTIIMSQPPKGGKHFGV